VQHARGASWRPASNASHPAQSCIPPIAISSCFPTLGRLPVRKPLEPGFGAMSGRLPFPGVGCHPLTVRANAAAVCNDGSEL
jgi:hypothetical protein